MSARRPAPVRYGGVNDRLLRLALLEAWGWQCYWRGEPLSVATAQIDHIIPRTVQPARLAELIALHDLPADFDVDMPANLGPICGPCNNDKRAHDYLAVPAVHTKLAKARRLSPTVVRRVRAQKTAVTVGRSLIQAVTADLSEPAARDEFLAFAPAVVQTLALLDEDQVDYVARRTLDLYLGHDRLPVSLTLDARGRTWYAWVEQICGRPWPLLLQAGIDGVIKHAGAAFEQAFRDQCGDTADMVSHETIGRTVELEITTVRRDTSLMICQLSGQLELETSGTARDAQPPDLEIFDMEVGAYILTQFQLTISWDLTTSPAQHPHTDMVMTDAHVDVAIGRRLK